MNRSTRSKHITVQPKRITVQRPLGVPRLLGVAALSLALVPAHGALGAAGKAVANVGQTKNVASASTISMLPTRVSFDGTLVTASNVDSFAKDPVLAFGPGLDADGHTIPGEMWLLVAKDAKAIFYELTEEHASGTGSYAGYTVKVKTVTTHGILNYGAGEDVPVIGNDEDGFVVATTELFVSSKFASISGPKCMTTSGQPCAPTVSMLTAGTVVQVANIPASMSAGREAALQVFDAAGNLVDESSAMAIASSSSSGDCRNWADGIVNDVESFQDTMLGIGQSGTLVLYALAGGATGAIAGTGAGGGVQSASGAAVGGMAGVGAGIAYTNDVLVPMTNGIANAAQFVTSAVVWGLADGACNLASLGSDLLNSIEQIDLGVGELEDCGGQMVCDAYGTEQIGSVATYGTETLPDGSTVESVTVSPVDGQVCTESHVEFACVTG